MKNETTFRKLGWVARMRVKRLDVRLAGLRAKLAATKEAIEILYPIPEVMLYELRELPKMIAEMEETRRQIFDRHK